ncbi:MAG: S8 family serine peptidase, partial [Chloroflexota bacterium]
MAQTIGVDPLVERELDHFGFAQVLVVLRNGVVAAAASAERGGRRPSAVLEHFLSDIPAAAGGPTIQRPGRRARRGGAASITGAAPPAEPPAARYFSLLGVAAGYVDQRGAGALAADPSVEAVYHADPLSLIRPVRVAAARPSRRTWGLRRLGVESLWQQGLTGKGVRVGHLDTGVDGAHPALSDRIAAFMEFDLFGNRVPGSRPHDTGDHGTHTAGTICGGRAGGMAIGVAPE